MLKPKRISRGWSRLTTIAKRKMIDPRKHITPSPDDNLAEQFASRKKQSAAVKALLQEWFSLNVVFHNLDIKAINQVIGEMSYFQIPAGTVIYEQGTMGSYYFAIEEGEIDLVKGEDLVKSLQREDDFGVQALIHTVKRPASAVAKTDCCLWGLSREQYVNISKQLSQSSYNQLRTFVQNVPLLQGLRKQDIESIVQSVDHVQFMQGEVIMREGDQGDMLYIIEQGDVQVSTKQKGNISTMMRADYFGEMALLNNAPRTATITAINEVKCITLNRDDVFEHLGEDLQPILYRNSIFIAMENNPTLNGLTLDQKSKVAHAMHIDHFQEGDVVIDKHEDVGHRMRIVLSGSLKHRRNIYDSKTCIGAEEMTAGRSLTFNDIIYALEESDIASITVGEFELAIGECFQAVRNHNEAFKVLQSLTILRTIPDDIIKELIKKLQVIHFDLGDIIIRQDDPGDQFFIIKSGKVQVIDHKTHVRNLGQGDYFGERALLFNEPRTMGITALEQVECWILPRDAFLEVIDERSYHLLVDRIKMQDLKAHVSDTHIVKELGHGSFGDVYLTVGKSADKPLFALKGVDKNKIVQFQLFDSINLERELLLQLHHDMILSLYSTYKNNRNIFFLTELVKGCELFDAEQEMGALSDADAKFYTICIIEILEYLHDRNIIYRDLKPENVMVDHEGFPKLIDFGTAKFIEGRTFTIVGTPAYMAPEVLQGKGYTITADYWSLGIMVYEFFAAALPFGMDDEPDPMKIMELICDARLVFPSNLGHTFPAKGFIERLLNRNPVFRTGGRRGPLKNEQWLQDVNWNDVNQKRLNPPYIPNTSSNQAEIDAAWKGKVPADYTLWQMEKKMAKDKPMQPPEDQENWDAAF